MARTVMWRWCLTLLAARSDESAAHPSAGGAAAAARADVPALLDRQTISLFGDQVSILALPLTAILVLHAGAAETGYLTAAGLAPSLLFSVLAGGWVDRRGHRRRVMLTADIVRAALLASIPLAYVAGVLTFAQLYSVAFRVGCASVLFNVAQSTVFASIVRPSEYVDANSLIHGSRALSFVGGQSAGGILVQLVTAPGAVALDAVSFLGSALFLWRIHPAEPATAPGGRGHLLEGVRFIVRSREVRALLGATATINVFGFIAAAIFVLYATRGLGVSPAQLGLVLGAGAIGAVVGAAITSRVARRLGVGGAFTLSCVIFPAPFILVPLASGMTKPVILALLFGAEFGSGIGVVMPRHHHRRDPHRQRPCPAARSGFGRVQHHQLRPASRRCADRRCARQHSGAAADDVDGGRRRIGRRPVAAALADPADAPAPRAG
ncbi:MAG TPA: MFS transporter [Candidatus Deferrimicrobium sp.]|nr:MFS transporter [Candidatus Deferrimicrobium sp.]